MVGDKVAEDLLGPIQQSTTGAKRGLEIAQEAVEEGMGHKEDQPESRDGRDVMMEVVVGVPLVTEFIEALVLNAPAFMAEEDDVARGNLGSGQRGDPDPLGG